MLIIALIFWRKQLFAARREFCRFLLPTILVFAFQIVWVQAIYLTTPTISSLLSKLDIVFVALFAFFLFKSERKIVASRYFIIGATMALIGVVGVTLGSSQHLESEFNLGIGLLILRALIWASYTFSIKNLVIKVEPFVAATWVFCLASILFLPTVLFLGDIYAVTRVDFHTNLILFGSGALCVGLGNACNYTAIKHLGATLQTTMLLIIPFFVAILSYFIFDEVLTIAQIASGILIILSCWLIMRKVGTNSVPPS